MTGGTPAPTILDATGTFAPGGENTLLNTVCVVLWSYVDGVGGVGLRLFALVLLMVSLELVWWW